MKLLKNALIFAVVFIVVTQFAISSLVPIDLVYKDRIKYRVFKNNTDTIEAVIDKIKERIDRENLKDYVILLGDSVAFSTPVAEEDSLAPLFESLAAKDGYNTVFFNLGIPSEYPGDLYALIKMLQQHGISTEHLIINFNYFEFIVKKTGTSVFWLKEELKEVDREAYDHIYSPIDKTSIIKKALDTTSSFLGKNLNILLYRDFIRAGLSSLFVKNYHDFVADVRPWYEKKGLYENMKKSDNSWYFAAPEIVLDESNSCVYFINKISDLQKGKHTLAFLPGFNRELLKAELSKEEFNLNLQKIDRYFESKPLEYVNYDKRLDYRQYADFVHLTPEGYKNLAENIWQRYKNGLTK